MAGVARTGCGRWPGCDPLDLRRPQTTGRKALTPRKCRSLCRSGLGRRTLSARELLKRFGCGGPQRSERTQVAFSSEIGRNGLINQRSSPFPSGSVVTPLARPGTSHNQRPSVAPGRPMASPATTDAAPIVRNSAKRFRHDSNHEPTKQRTPKPTGITCPGSSRVQRTA